MQCICSYMQNTQVQQLKKDGEHKCQAYQTLTYYYYIPAAWTAARIFINEIKSWSDAY